jgi:hypothetical protein
VRRGGPAVPSVAGATSADEVQAFAAAATARLPRPTAPAPAGGAPALSAARASIAARGAVRTRQATVAPRRLAGAAPVPHHSPPHEDPGPIPDQMQAIREKSALTLPPATLPAIPASPRGTVPDLARPVLSTEEIRAIRVGESLINITTADPDERARLLAIRNELLTGQTASAPAPDSAAAGAPRPSAPPLVVQDEPVGGVELDRQQRALFTRVIGELRRDVPLEARGILDTIRTQHTLYPNGILHTNFPELGTGILLPELQTIVTQETGALAQAIGLVPEQIDAAIAERRTEVETLSRQAAASTAAAGTQTVVAATDASQRRAAAARRSAEATTRAVATDRAASGRRHRPTIQDRVTVAIDDIQRKIATARAGYDAQLRNRERALTSAVQREISAIRLAGTRDELAIERAGGPDAEIQEGLVQRWVEAQIAALGDANSGTQKRLTDDARASIQGYKIELDTAAGVAFTALRDWGRRQSTVSEDWWTRVDADLGTWAREATAHTIHWQLEQGEEARVALAQDLAAVKRIVELQHAQDTAGVHAYIASLDAETQVVVRALSASSQQGATDLAGALSAGLRARIRSAQRQRIEDELQNRILLRADPGATADEIERLQTIVRATNPTPAIRERVASIHSSVTRYRGFDEQAIFTALQGLTPLGGKVLRLVYQQIHDQSLDDALHGYGHVGWLNEDEYMTAQQMLTGNNEAAVNGAVGAINSAITGLGTNKEAIKRILRGLSDAQRQEVSRRYSARYGESFETAIRGEWISSSQQDEMIALSDNRVRDADAIALGRTVETHTTQGDEGGGGGEQYATIDREEAQAVFAQVRREVEEEGGRRNWTSAQVEAEIALRGHEIEQQFNVRFSNEWWAREGAPGTSAMRTAFSLSGGAGRDLLNAVADNDLRRVDVARIQLEDQGTYAEDAAINAVFRDQNSRSLAEVNRDLGPAMHARAERMLADEASSGRFPSEAERLNRRMQLERENAAELSRLADERTRTRMSALGAAYQQASGRTLGEMVEANMSGAARDEARARVAQGGVVSNYQRVRFAIEGAGTDLPMLRSALESMSPSERARARAQWAHDHDGESLEDAIRGDTSGRDEDDMMDLLDYGAPRNVDEVVGAARRRFNRDREGGTGLGDWLTSDEVDDARRQVRGLEADLAQLHRRDLSPLERTRLSGHFDMAVENANLAIEIQRNAVDAWADMLANAAALVAAVIVGAAVEFFSGGTATPLVVAVIASLAGTAASMATKRLVKGSAYGLEEFETDLAVGAVDALMATMTAGLGNALLGGAGRGVSSAARSGMNKTLGEMGRLVGPAARAQSRFASLVSRGPATGLLARASERSALFEGLEVAGRPMWQRLALHGAAQFVETGIQSLPSSFVGAIADERVWRQPGGGPALVARNTLAGAAHSTAMGMGFAAAHAAVGHMIGTIRGRPPESRVPANDVLDRLGTPSERLADFRAWQGEHPDGTYREFYAERQERAIEQQRTSAETAEQLRSARRELLADLPPHERGNFADVPILNATDAELRRLVGDAPGDAHLVVRDGQAVVVLREGAPPSSVRPLLGEIRDRVFARSGGLTLEGALPPHLRESVPVRRDPTLQSDTVRVVPIPPDGPIRSLEVVVGPTARPIDVALHVEAIERVRRWTGAVGEVRMAVASVAEHLGVTLDTPADRLRFEAIGELEKLQPIIEERIRRAAEVAGDPQASARVEAEVQNLLAQQERARRILSGELQAEPRGYIAAEGGESAVVTEPAPEAEPPTAAETMRRANELQRRIQEIGERRAPIEEEVTAAAEDQERAANNLYEVLVGREPGAPRVALEVLGGGPEEFHETLADARRARRLRRVVETEIGRASPERAAKLRRELEFFDNASDRFRRARQRDLRWERRLANAREQLSALPDAQQRRSAANRELTFDRVGEGPDVICFPPDTLVATPSGPVPIASLRAGRAVFSQRGGVGTVTGVHTGWTDWLVELEVEGSTVYLTRRHRVRVADPPCWIPARLMRPGMSVVVRSNHPSRVERAAFRRRVTATWNLEVEPGHTFYVGAGELLVHNGADDVELGDAPRRFNDATRYEAEIYYVSLRNADGTFTTVYVGSTNSRRLTTGRFEQHLAQGRLPETHSKFRADKREWARRFDNAGADVEISNGGLRRRYGDILVEVVRVGRQTDLSLAIIEQAHMNKFPREQLTSNRIEALTREGFEKYYTDTTWSKHAPC